MSQAVHCISSVLIFLLVTATAHTQQTEELLERGLREEARGNYRVALDVWQKAKTRLPDPSLTIGTNYIRLAAEQEITGQYRSASAMYRWGLSAERIGRNRTALALELSRLAPLLDEERREAWERLLEEEDPELLRRIRLWWRTLDPTPATAYNERLIEHWQRIAYARRHFTRTDESVYGTDERGPVYVRYGQPDRTFEDKFNITRTKALQTIADIGMGSRSPNARALANAAANMSENPTYEVWVYLADLLDHRENIVVMFGEKPMGGFDRLTTLEELIPARAFTFSERYNHQSLLDRQRGIPEYKSKLNPGMILQWTYYKELASADSYFAEKFREMEFTWTAYERLERYLGDHFRQKHFHTTPNRLKKAPKEASAITRELPEIPLQIHRYRLLDARNRPVFAVFLGSQPQQAFLKDLAHNQDSMLADRGPLPDSTAVRKAFGSYRFYHGMELRDPQGQRLAGRRRQTTLMLDGTDMNVESGSVFTVPYVSGDADQVFYAELHNRHPSSVPRVETPFPDHLRGLGKTKLAQPEPLDTDPSTLEMGDLILGYEMNDSASTDSFVPFVVANDRKVPEGEDLAVHIEVYHLRPDSDGVAKFQLHYEIKPKNFLGWTREKKEEFGITLNLETDQNRWTEDLQIKAPRLAPGDYVLRMEATERSTGRQIKREIEFKVTETEG